MIPTVLFNCRRYLNPRPLLGYRHRTQSSAISTRTPVGIFTVSPGASVKLTGAKKSYPALPVVARFGSLILHRFHGSFLPAVPRRYPPVFFELFPAYFMKFCDSFHVLLLMRVILPDLLLWTSAHRSPADSGFLSMEDSHLCSSRSNLPSTTTSR